MKVYDLPGRKMILCYSNGELGHMPGISEDRNQYS